MAEQTLEVTLPQATLDAIAARDAALIESNKAMDAKSKDEKDDKDCEPTEKAMDDEECEKAFADLEKAKSDLEDEKCKAMPPAFKDFIAKKRGNKGKETEKSMPVVPDMSALEAKLIASVSGEVTKAAQAMFAELSAKVLGEKTESEKAIGELKEIVKALGDAPAPRKTLMGGDLSEVMKSIESRAVNSDPVLRWMRNESTDGKPLGAPRVDGADRVAVKTAVEKGGVAALLQAQHRYSIPAEVVASAIEGVR